MGEGGARADAGDHLTAERDVAVVYVLYQNDDVDLTWIPSGSAALVVAVHNDGAERTRLTGSDVQIEHLVPGANLGFGAAVNLAAARIEARRLVLVNPDTRLDRRHWTALAEDVADDEIVTIPMIDSDGVPAHSIRRYPGPVRHLLGGFRAGRLARRGTMLRPAPLPTEDAVHPLTTHWTSGAALSISTEQFRRVGGFDPAFFLYYEDVDLCRKLAGAGMTLRLRATPPALHTVGGSAGRSEVVERIRLESAITWSDRQSGIGWKAVGALLRQRHRAMGS